MQDGLRVGLLSRCASSWRLLRSLPPAPNPTRPACLALITVSDETAMCVYAASTPQIDLPLCPPCSPSSVAPSRPWPSYTALTLRSALAHAAAWAVPKWPCSSPPSATTLETASSAHASAAGPLGNAHWPSPEHPARTWPVRHLALRPQVLIRAVDVARQQRPLVTLL